MLHSNPGALSSNRLDERPANLPTSLYINGGRASSRVSVVIFGRDEVRVESIESSQQLESLLISGHPLWLRVNGLADGLWIKELLRALQLPVELLSVLLDVPQRVRISSFDGVLLVVLHRLGFAHEPSHLISSQLSMLLLPGILITVDEVPAAKPVELLTNWLRSQEVAVEQRDLDDILHYLIDQVLDDLFPMLEHIALHLDDLEFAALRKPKPKLLNRTFQYRSNLRTIRAQIWPLRHQVRVMLRQRQQLLGAEALVGFQEMGELVDLLFEHIELLRAQCDAITQAYAASVANRMNQVMKTLTILTSIFAPLTLVAGIYGMNFKNIPELDFRFGYEYALVLMAAIALAMVIGLWRRGWFEDWTSPR